MMEAEKKVTCFCRIMGTNFYFYRLFCIFPYTWTHVEDRCVFKISLPWIMLSIGSIGFVSYMNFSTMLDYKWDTLPNFFTSTNKLISSLLFTIIILTVNLRPKAWCAQLEVIANMVNEGVCPTGKKYMRSIQIIMILVATCLPLIMFLGAIIFADNDFVTNGDFWMIYVHFVPFAFVTNFGSFILIFINMYVCYSSVLKLALKYEPQHPDSRIDIGNKKFAKILGVIEVCTCNPQQHKSDVSESMERMPNAQLMDVMRWKQENYCVMFRRSNNIMYLPFEAFFAIEIFLVFVQYLFVINMVFTRQHLHQQTLLAYALVYIIAKQIVILMIMNASYLVIVTTSSVRHILLEYSTRHTDPKLDVLTRIFLSKLEFMPTAVRTLGLNKVGNDDILPIFEFLLTQALVEIQFFQMF